MNAEEMHVVITPYVLILLEATIVAARKIMLEIHSLCVYLLKQAAVQILLSVLAVQILLVHQGKL